ncbi:MAG: DNA-packaging protein, partial [Paracoccaceae bacterium]
GGRGAGKTRAGAEWVRAQVEGAGPHDAGRCRRVALLADTLEQVREVMVFGESGLVASSPPDRKPEWVSTRRMLVWPNGATAQAFSASDPERLRGPQFDCAWSDELAKWRKGEATWDMLQFALRLGDDPRQIVTTTPRPSPLLRKILADGRTVKTSAPTAANRANLAPDFVENVAKRYGGTRLGRQEIDGELLDDVEGALWTFRQFETLRARNETPLDMIVVAIDPPASDGEGADECGLIVAGAKMQGEPLDWTAHVIADGTVQGVSPTEWGREAVALARAYDADRIVAEVNQGGNMVETIIRQTDPTVRVRSVRARQGKVTRADPVAMLYEQGRVTHEGRFRELEDQMTRMTTGGYRGSGSPDRVDALVWALTDLIVEPSKSYIKPRMRSL